MKITNLLFYFKISSVVEDNEFGFLDLDSKGFHSISSHRDTAHTVKEKFGKKLNDALLK